LVEEGYDSQREIYTMTTEEVLSYLKDIVIEAQKLGGLPVLMETASD
jgi:hypothetical protein